LRFDAWMRAEIERRFGVHIAKTYYAPHHPDGVVDAFKGDSPLRKPNPGMILAAQRDFDLDLASSALIGDNESDIIAGKRAGVGWNVLCVSGTDSATVADAAVSRLSEVVEKFARR
jgi:D-glycero-D-manno-heptose 1,7-bisphosphate phosphatase